MNETLLIRYGHRYLFDSHNVWVRVREMRGFEKIDKEDENFIKGLAIKAFESQGYVFYHDRVRLSIGWLPPVRADIYQGAMYVFDVMVEPYGYVGRK